MRLRDRVLRPAKTPPEARSLPPGLPLSEKLELEEVKRRLEGAEGRLVAIDRILEDWRRFEAEFKHRQ